MGKRRDRRHAAALGGGGRRMKLDLWNDDDAEKLSTNGRIVSRTATVEEGDENIGDGGDEGHSPQSLPGGFTGLALMVVLQARVCLPGHFFEANCLHKLDSAEMIWKLESDNWGL